jgi:von Willebrand factor type A domain
MMDNATTTAAPAPAVNPQAAALARLHNRDYYILVDKSGSMETADTPSGKSRWDYCKEESLLIAKKLTEFDPDGCTFVPFSGKPKVYPNTTPDRLEKIFNENWPSGGTDLAAALQTCYDDYSEQRKAKTQKANGIMIVVITDGVPDDEDAVAKGIVKFSKTLDHDDECGISFLQVGKDAHATAYLKRLDDHLEKEGAKFDIVNAKTIDDLENVSLVDAMIAALDE